MENVMKMDIWTPDMRLEKKSCQIMLTERIPGKKEISRLVTIEDGEIVEKPEDVEILGILTPEGFTVRGLRIKNENEDMARCIICGKDDCAYKFWTSENHPWMKLCEVCWDLPYKEKQDAIEKYRKKIFKEETK